MTKKDYVAIANKMLTCCRCTFEGNPDTYLVMREVFESLADTFEADNPRFDRARFLAACGVLS